MTCKDDTSWGNGSLCRASAANQSSTVCYKNGEILSDSFPFFDCWYGIALYVSGSALAKELTWVSAGTSSPANISFVHAM